MKILIPTMKRVCLETFFKQLKEGKTIKEIAIMENITEKEIITFIDIIKAIIEESEAGRFL